MVIASVVQRWLMDQLTTNVANITFPGTVEHFIKLADGSYNPPFGTASTLTFANGAFTYVTTAKETLTFDAATGNLARWASPSGPAITLGYNTASPPQLTTISNNLGRRSASATTARAS
jgi:hypothetical protein